MYKILLSRWVAGGQAVFAAYLSTCTPTPSSLKDLLHATSILHRSDPPSQSASSLSRGTHVKHRPSSVKRISETYSDKVVTVR